MLSSTFSGELAICRSGALTYEQDNLYVDTCLCSDTRMWETAIADKCYRSDGNLIIVEEYTSKDSAEKGHKKWLKLMTKNPPKELVDVHIDVTYERKEV